MKISDSELLKLIWQRQIFEASKGVLNNYIGGGVGLCDDNDFWCASSTDVHICNRNQITDKIGKQQILKRIRQLIDSGELVWVHRDLTFSIADKDKVERLFNNARDFWLDNGIPEGITNGECNTVEVANLDELKGGAFEFLSSKESDNG